MSETLLGVIIGGILSSIIPTIMFFDSRTKWLTEKQITRLESKKITQENNFKKACTQLLRLLEEKKVGHEIFHFDISLPKEIRKVYDKLLSEKEDPKKSQKNYWDLQIQMMQYLESIETEIDELINLQNHQLTRANRKFLHINFNTMNKTIYALISLNILFIIFAAIFYLYDYKPTKNRLNCITAGISANNAENLYKNYITCTNNNM
jgi:hypothetical protein